VKETLVTPNGQAPTVRRKGTVLIAGAVTAAVAVAGTSAVATSGLWASKERGEGARLP
jgi:hypothetical protein